MWASWLERRHRKFWNLCLCLQLQLRCCASFFGGDITFLQVKKMQVLFRIDGFMYSRTNCVVTVVPLTGIGGRMRVPLRVLEVACGYPCGYVRLCVGFCRVEVDLTKPGNPGMNRPAGLTERTRTRTRQIPGWGTRPGISDPRSCLVGTR